MHSKARSIDLLNKRFPRRLKWYLSAVSTILSSLFVVALEMEP